jgi:hypothetical protein
MLKRVRLRHAWEARHAQPDVTSPCVSDSDPPADACTHKRRSLSFASLGNSRTGSRLIQKVSTGSVHAVDVQRSAADIVADFGVDTGVISDLASLGASGSKPSNVHRDLIRWAAAGRGELMLSPVSVQVAHRNPSDHGSILEPHKVCNPFAAL